VIGVVGDCILRTELGASLTEFNAPLRCDDHRVQVTGFKNVVLAKVNARVAIDT
jgi:hypothetical protein